MMYAVSASSASKKSRKINPFSTAAVLLEPELGPHAGAGGHPIDGRIGTDGMVRVHKALEGEFRSVLRRERDGCAKQRRDSRQERFQKVFHSPFSSLATVNRLLSTAMSYFGPVTVICVLWPLWTFFISIFITVQ